MNNIINGKCYLLLTILIIISCDTTGDTDRIPLAQGDPNPIDSLNITLPEDFQNLENLKVYSLEKRPKYDIEFIPEQSYSGHDHHSFTRQHDIAVGNENRVYIKKGLFIYVYDSNNNHLATMGGDGRGPGEFNMFGENELKISSKHLFLYDTELHRINIYSTETFQPTGTIVIDPSRWTQIDSMKGTYPGSSYPSSPTYHVLDDSTILMRFNGTLPIRQLAELGNRYDTYETNSRYYLMDLEGNVTSDQLFSFTDIIQISGPAVGGRPLPIYPKSLITTYNNELIYAAWSEILLIKKMDSNGNHLETFYYPTDRRVIQEEQIRDSFALNKITIDRMRNSDLPKLWPVLDAIFVDNQNRIWVSTISESNDYFQWYVLGTSGELLAKFKWPGDPLNPYWNARSIRTIKNGYLFAYEDTGIDEYDVPYGHFVRYKISFTPIPD